jgi:SAM-dependent methyltransferase
MTVDQQNAAYWNSLCGWALAREVPMTGDPHQDLRLFDAAYLDYYPYLLDYIDPKSIAGRDVLEIGLGYGTVGQLLAVAGARYVGVDIALEPVYLMQRRLEYLSDSVTGRAIQASALALPFERDSFDFAYSIGCLHHTGDLGRAINELRRVLRPGGMAIVMVYYAHSTRRHVHKLRRMLHGRRTLDGDAAAMYDVNPNGAPPPHTEYVSRRRARELFADFSDVRVEVRNFAEFQFNGHVLKRSWFLDNAAHVVGLDLYVRAVK